MALAVTSSPDTSAQPPVPTLLVAIVERYPCRVDASRSMGSAPCPSTSRWPSSPMASGLGCAWCLGVSIKGGAIVVGVRPHGRERLRCPVCGRRCECHDHEPARRWRAMGLARSVCHLEYRPARARCPEHGVLVERVPWARRGSRFTRDLEDWVACLAVRCCTSAVSRIARVEWHSVGGICGRVHGEIEAARGSGRFDGLQRTGIDETSHKRGHRYLAVVVGHDRGCLAWAHEGCGKEVPSPFLDGLTRKQRWGTEVVTADGARRMREPVKRRCPNARRVMGPFHVVQRTSGALDEARREGWQAAKAGARAVVPRTGRRGRPRKNEVAPEVAAGLAAGAAPC